MTEDAPENDMTGPLLDSLKTLDAWLTGPTCLYDLTDAPIEALKQLSTLVPMLLEDYGTAWEAVDAARSAMIEQAAQVDRKSSGLILPT